MLCGTGTSRHICAPANADLSNKDFPELVRILGMKKLYWDDALVLRLCNFSSFIELFIVHVPILFLLFI